MRLATARQMKQLDQAAIRERGIASLELMERAAEALVREVLELAPERETPVGRGKQFFYLPEATGEIIGADGETALFRRGGARNGPPRAVCFCGPGNNGGDGMAAARLLLAEGWKVRALLVGRREKLTPDAAEMERRLMAAGGVLEDFQPGNAAQLAAAMEADVLVDAVFGVGLNTPMAGAQAAAVQAMNASPAPTVAADLPSGVEADTGRVLGAAVEAAVTVTFTLPKIGCCVGSGAVCAGKLVTADIGIPTDLTDAGEYPVQTVTRRDVSLPRRARDSHKGDYGRVYILGGSADYTGAPVLAAEAAVRSGAGLVSVGVPTPVWPVAAGKLSSAMPHPLPADRDGRLSAQAAAPALERMSRCGACLIGPGLGRSGGVDVVVRGLLEKYRGSVVLDADGINAVAGHIDILDSRRDCVTVLTPHDGEFARLGGAVSGGDRLGAARSFARAHGCCLVLKGHRTITAFPDGAASVNTTGNPGMAKGGSGDVLSGIILSLLGQGLPARQAVPLAVWLHGAAGDLAAEKLGEYGMAPVDLISMLPGLTKQLSR